MVSYIRCRCSRGELQLLLSGLLSSLEMLVLAADRGLGWSSDTMSLGLTLVFKFATGHEWEMQAD